MPKHRAASCDHWPVSYRRQLFLECDPESADAGIDLDPGVFGGNRCRAALFCMPQDSILTSSGQGSIPSVISYDRKVHDHHKAACWDVWRVAANIVPWLLGRPYSPRVRSTSGFAAALPTNSGIVSHSCRISTLSKTPLGCHTSAARTPIQGTAPRESCPALCSMLHAS